MTNWDFYGWSYQLAQYAFDCWYHICQTSREYWKSGYRKNPKKAV